MVILVVVESNKEEIKKLSQSQAVFEMLVRAGSVPRELYNPVGMGDRIPSGHIAYLNPPVFYLGIGPVEIGIAISPRE
jgi:hypothetical protein